MYGRPKTRLRLDKELRPKYRVRLWMDWNDWYNWCEGASKKYWGHHENWKAKNHTEQVCKRRKRRTGNHASQA